MCHHILLNIEYSKHKEIVDHNEKIVICVANIKCQRPVKFPSVFCISAISCEAMKSKEM